MRRSCCRSRSCKASSLPVALQLQHVLPPPTGHLSLLCLCRPALHQALPLPLPAADCQRPQKQRLLRDRQAPQGEGLECSWDTAQSLCGIVLLWWLPGGACLFSNETQSSAMQTDLMQLSLQLMDTQLCCLQLGSKLLNLAALLQGSTWTVSWGSVGAACTLSHAALLLMQVHAESTMKAGT